MDADCIRHDSRRFTSIYLFYMFPDLRAWMIHASGTTLADLHAFITLKAQIELTIPLYVVYHPVHISYSVCRYDVIHCPPPVYTLRHQEALQRWGQLA